ncbi:MAG: hypothetical protein PVI30_23815 [Myxococcales bacterium]|jgi:hypothetical protein
MAAFGQPFELAPPLHEYANARPFTFFVVLLAGPAASLGAKAQLGFALQSFCLPGLARLIFPRLILSAWFSRLA